MTLLTSGANTPVNISLNGVADEVSLGPLMTLVTMPAEMTQTIVVLRALLSMVTGIPPLGPLIVLAPV